MKNKVDKRTLRLAVGAALCAFVFVFCFARLVFKTDIRGAFNAADFDTSKDFVKIMDVGQADSILIYSNGCSAVIDGHNEIMYGSHFAGVFDFFRRCVGLRDTKIVLYRLFK